jgi:hypothetical protein
MGINIFLEKFIRFSCVIGIISVWTLLSLAKVSRYDANYGFAIWAFIVSIFFTELLIISLIFKREIFLNQRFGAMVFLIFASPLSIAGFIYFYETFLGQFFAFD